MSKTKPLTSTEKSNTRKALMTAAALRDGILKDGKVSWSFAITMWIQGKARMAWVAEPVIITLPVIITGEAHTA